MTGQEISLRKLAAIAFISLALIAGGCGSVSPESVPGGNAGGPTEAPAPTESSGEEAAESPDAEEEPVLQIEVKVYGTDEQLAELTERTVTLSYREEAELVGGMLAELQDGGDEYWTPLWTGIKFLSATIAEDTAIIDIHIEDEARKGSIWELLMLESLQATLFQLDSVQAIELLVDGEAVESMMGHVQIDHPIVRESH